MCHDCTTVEIDSLPLLSWSKEKVFCSFWFFFARRELIKPDTSANLKIMNTDGSAPICINSFAYQGLFCYTDYSKLTLIAETD